MKIMEKYLNRTINSYTPDRQDFKLKDFEAEIIPDVYDLICNYPSYTVMPEEMENSSEKRGIKIEEMLLPLTDIYDLTKEELKGYFTFEEACELYNEFGQYNFYELRLRNMTDPKEMLIKGIFFGRGYYELLPNRTYELKNKLIYKIEKLSAFQCYTVIMLICELQNSYLEDYSNVNYDLIRRAFLVK